MNRCVVRWLSIKILKKLSIIEISMEKSDSKYELPSIFRPDPYFSIGLSEASLIKATNPESSSWLAPNGYMKLLKLMKTSTPIKTITTAVITNDIFVLFLNLINIPINIKPTHDRSVSLLALRYPSAQI
jgi:hypothetical protein